MSKKIRFFTALCLFAISFITPASIAKATPPSPLRDYLIKTPNGKFVLAVLIPDTLSESYPPSPEIRAKYPHSGLYSQDGSLLWAIEWYLIPGRAKADELITLLNDGEHLITWTHPIPYNFVGETACDDIALGFYKQGQELKSYRIKDLVACPGILPRIEGGYFWKASYSVNQETRILRIITNDGQILFFKITNGELIGKLGWQSCLWVLIGIIAICGFAVISKRAYSKRVKAAN